jgi:5-methylcytosine-specific restriction protein B
MEGVNMRVRIRGKEYQITREDIERSVEGIEPDVGRVYFVDIKGKEYPVKQVIGNALHLPMATFSTLEAYNFLTRLGYDIIVKEYPKNQGVARV